jgi:hypothetical protein
MANPHPFHARWSVHGGGHIKGPKARADPAGQYPALTTPSLKNAMIRQNLLN